jgi:hypothetical protein
MTWDDIEAGSSPSRSIRPRVGGRFPVTEDVKLLMTGTLTRTANSISSTNSNTGGRRPCQPQEKEQINARGKTEEEVER